MDENKIVSVMMKVFKKLIPSLKKSEIFLIILIVVMGFKSEILSYGSYVLKNSFYGANTAVVTQDKVIENDINRSMIDERILEEVQNISKSNENITKLLTPKETNDHIVYCGINNVDISNWELSATPENPLGLKDGDKIVVKNKDYDIHLQTAVFFVKIFRKENPNSPNYYMNEETAHCLGIEDAKSRGRFTVSLQAYDVKKI